MSGEAAMAAAVRPHSQRVLKPSEIVTHRFPRDDINQAYHTFSAKLDNCIKPLIVPNGH
jgi:threonine dehydrogenase-like Zn-dependent dehydrogenase